LCIFRWAFFPLGENWIHRGEYQSLCGCQSVNVGVKLASFFPCRATESVLAEVVANERRKNRGFENEVGGVLRTKEGTRPYACLLALQHDWSRRCFVSAQVSPGI
jgi:hypothetical protein